MPHESTSSGPGTLKTTPDLAESGLSRQFAAKAHKVIAHFTKMSRIRLLASRRRPLR